MKLVYADPPYLGMCDRYGHDHRDWGCFDDVDTHAALIDHLDTFDGWAYSLTSNTLADILPHARGARIAAWVKPWAAFKVGVDPAYAWEPVLFRSGRDWAQRGGREARTTRDWLAASVAINTGLFGAKPAALCRWVLDLMGYREGDEVIDLFPGTGSLTREMAQGVLL